MKIPKEIAEKVRQYEGLKKELANCFEELEEWLKENTDADGCDIEEIFITDKPTGAKQFDDEYCDQRTGYICDDYSGYYYHAIEDSEEYLGYSYNC